MYDDLIRKLIPKLFFNFPYTAEDYAKHLYLENYHSHSYFSNSSTPDSPTSMEDYATRIKELGGKCLYSMEHGWQGNFYANYDIAEKEGLIPIHGTEAYWVYDRHAQDRTNCHIIVHALNDEGRKEINYMLSIANEDGFYGHPRIDEELLLQLDPKNVLVTSACFGGWKYADAEQFWLRMAKHFGRHFFLEVQNHNTNEQKELNKKIIRIAKENHIDIICGLDSHYINTETDDVRRNQILQYKGITYPDEEGWYLDYPDTPTVIKRFQEQGVLTIGQILRAIMNTNIFASEEVTPIVLDRHFKIPTVMPDATYNEKCKEYKRILNEAYKKDPLRTPKKAEGIKQEVKEVIDSNVVDYFLTSKAIIDDAVQNEGGTLTTTSRGSSASFVTNKLLGLTTIDRFNSDVPIYWQRFLTAERVNAGSMPDIDMNIASQEPFVKAAKKLLGEHGVYPLMAIEKLKEKNAWQMYASNEGVDPTTANKISTYIDAYNIALKHADDDEKDSIYIEDYIPEPYLSIYEKSKNYQNIVTNLKCHSCGHFLLNDDIRREIGIVSAISRTNKNRVLCAAIEGSYLDEFGYVKEDFLIVDAVSLTKEFFDALGRPVPSFTELKEMIKGDKLTWDIYANGITCCINQCEKASTTAKVMKYKPQNIAELALFVAAIRPGFASLLNTFLNREPYTTGEPKIDELLSDTAHFMIYQESIMKVLSFLGLPMGETYKVIKSISKKKLKGEKKEHLLAELKEGWMNKFGNLDNFDAIWKVISDAARYSFNAPHAYSYAGDSLYQAYVKGHYPKVFYEVAIRHYQLKNNKNKIDALIKEAVKFYGYHLGEYEFGSDNRQIHIDEETKTIYSNLSAIKGFGDKVGESLYEIGLNHYESFIDVLPILRANEIDSSTLDKLIKIGYFKQFGTVPKLLQIVKYYNDLKQGEAKQLSKDKAIKLGIPLELLRKYGNETLKQFNKLDSMSILKELIADIPDEKLTDAQRLRYEAEVLGMCKTIIPDADKRYYVVVSKETKKAYSNLVLYEVWSGNLQECKIWNSKVVDKFTDEVMLREHDLIYIQSLPKKNKRQRTDRIDPNTGKVIYEPIPNQYEYWLDMWEVCDDIE